jgi:two-component system nitrogen regulation response regulator NtrX
VNIATPFAVVIDDEKAICQLVAGVLAGLGMESSTYQTASPAIASFDQRRPDIIFLDIALEQSDAIDVIKGLGEKHYTGIVQLMSGGRLPLLEAVQRIGARNGLLLRTPLQKPIRAETIRDVIVSAGLAPHERTISGHVGSAASDSGWMKIEKPGRC